MTWVALAAILTAIGTVLAGTGAIIAARRAGRVEKAVGIPNGNGPAMEALHTVIEGLARVEGALYVEAVRREGLDKRFNDHLLSHLSGGD